MASRYLSLSTLEWKLIFLTRTSPRCPFGLHDMRLTSDQHPTVSTYFRETSVQVYCSSYCCASVEPGCLHTALIQYLSHSNTLHAKPYCRLTMILPHRSSLECLLARRERSGGRTTGAVDTVALKRLLVVQQRGWLTYQDEARQ